MNIDEAIEIILDDKKEYERIIKELEDVKDTNGNKPNETIQDCQKTIQAIETILAELEKKDKIIDAMALQLSGISIWDNQKEEPIILVSEDAVKEYYERKVKDE